MFYVNSRKGDLYGIIDTEDGVEDFCSKDQIKGFLKIGAKIAGIAPSGHIYTLNSKTARLWFSEKGIPVMVKSSPTLDWKQTLYCGMEEKDGKLLFKFFDGGLAPFGFSSDFISRSGVDFDFDNNDPLEMTQLIMQVKKGK